MSTFDERQYQVQQWQMMYGMEPRSDSRLTEMYANGQINWYPEEVARELIATDFIYKHTLYGETIEDFMKALAKQLKDTYVLDWKTTWKIVQFYGPIALKLLMLIKCDLKIPHMTPKIHG